jgi:hypothetical protein
VWYSVLADVIVGVHIAYVAFIVLGLLAIVVGIIRQWQWVRNSSFRLAHLVAITIVALEALLGIACPLTVWEDRLRVMAGEHATGNDFIGRCLHHVIFYQFAPGVFTLCYAGFALLVLATLVLAPPRWRSPASVSHPTH